MTSVTPIASVSIAGASAGSAAAPVGAGFGGLLAALGAGGALNLPAAGQGKLPAQGQGAAQDSGMGQTGASAEALLASKIQLAGGLRQFEAEVKAAVAEAQAEGNDDQAQAIVEGAAKVLGALLGQVDGASGTDTLAVLAQSLTKAGTSETASSEDAATQTDETATAQSDPMQQLEALFASLSAVLGLARPVPDVQATQSQVLLGQSAVPASLSPSADTTTAAAAAAAPQSLSQILKTMADAQPAQSTQPAPSAQENAPPLALALAQAGKAGKHSAASDQKSDPGVSALLKTVVANGSDAASARAESGSGAVPVADLFGGAVSAQAAAGAGGGGLPAIQTHTPASVQPTAQTGQQDQSASLSMQSSARFAGLVNGQIRSASFTGDQTRISLTPRGLGTIEIDMKRDDAGRMQVVLRADNPMVLSALRSDRDTLSAILTGSGLTADGGTLDFQEFSQGEQQGRKQGGGATLAALTDETGGEDPAQVQQTIGQGRLDIRT